MVDDRTKLILSGSNNEPESFKEIWTFIRKNDQWVLDEIDQKVSLGDVTHSSYVEK